MESEEKSLDILKHGALATHKETPGAEDFPQSRIVIPRLIIGQPNNISGFPYGVFVNNLSNETYETLEVVLLKFKQSRTLWAAGKPTPGDEPQCRSADAKTADRDFFGTMPCGRRCEEPHQLCVDDEDEPICKHAKWTHEGRPDCRLAYHLLLITVDTADVFILTLTGKGISPTNRLISNFKVKGKATYSARFKISLAKGNGEYYTIKYTDFSWLESPDELKAIFDAYKHTSITPSREEETTHE